MKGRAWSKLVLMQVLHTFSFWDTTFLSPQIAHSDIIGNITLENKSIFLHAGDAKVLRTLEISKSKREMKDEYMCKTMVGIGLARTSKQEIHKYYIKNQKKGGGEDKPPQTCFNWQCAGSC